MSKEFSFDIASEFDIQEMNNAIDQTKRELAVRFDFRGTNPEVNFDEDKKGLIIVADSDLKLNSIIDVLESKFVKRNLSLKILDKTLPADDASGGKVRKKIPFRKGLNQDQSKKITKLVRESFPKAKINIQGETIRVVSSSKDDLQGVMQLLRTDQSLDFPLQFSNFK